MKKFTLLIVLALASSLSFADTHAIHPTHSIHQLGSTFKIKQKIHLDKNDLIIGYGGEDVSTHSFNELA